MPAKKPRAILIGNMRTGTTFLRSYFEAHPDLTWSRAGEYFIETKNFRSKKHDAYLKAVGKMGSYHVDMFESLGLGMILEDGKQWEELESVADADMNKIHIDHAEVAKRIQEVLGEVKIIFSVRNQVTWINSCYRHFLPTINGSSLQDWCDTAMGKLVLQAANYHRTLRAYWDVFGKENVHVLLLEDITKKRKETLNGLCNFLGISQFSLDKKKEDRNTGKSVSELKLIQLSNKMRVPKTLVSKMAWIRPMLGTIGSRKQMLLTKKQQRMIRSLYAGSNLLLSRMIEKDLETHGYPI